MTDTDPKNSSADPLDELDAETVEDLDVDEEAEDVEGGHISLACVTSAFGICITE